MATRKRTTSRKSAAKPNDAIAVLKKDHEKVRDLLSKLEKSADRGGDRAMQLYTQVEYEVKIHSQVEEEIFYPAFRDAAQKKDDMKMFFEAKEEHHVVDLVMPELSDTDSKEEFAAKAKVLKELIEHHADEEEKEMFPRARKLFDRHELRELGERIEQRKSELQ
ncbi:MAG: hemerythrin domain-containing protein [Acidobacteriota bacterium]